MRVSTALFAATALMAATLASPFALAQDKSGENKAAAAGPKGPVAELAMAYDLYAYGVENKDALAVIAAAKIVATTPTNDIEREKETKVEDGADTTEEGEGAENPPALAEMLKSATELAAGNDTLTELVKDVEAAQPRGRVRGPGKMRSGLLAGRTDIFRENFRGGELAEVAIIGDGDTDLDLVIADENGNAICVDTSFADKLYCSWTPAWTGPFIIAVKNQGRIRNTYYILTN
ncbi:MAG TPA: hypothetical protein PKE65_05960 [Rhizobiaceae bacterium]|nr:hypothetical protein [Rhizobiaceae bacterium]